MSGPVVLVLRLLLTILLYAFLGWALYILWREVRQEGILLASRKVPPISITIDRTGFNRKIQLFVLPEVTIGRDPACECHVEDDAVSARHARLSFHHNQWWLEDLHSANGVHLNHVRLVMPTVIMSGDDFICGETHFLVTVGG